MMNFRTPATRWAVTFNVAIQQGETVTAQDIANIIQKEQYDRFYLGRRLAVLVEHKSAALSADFNREDYIVVKYDQFTDKGKDALAAHVKGIAYKLAERYKQDAVAYQATDTSETETSVTVEGFGGPRTAVWEPFEQAKFDNLTGLHSFAVLLP